MTDLEMTRLCAGAMGYPRVSDDVQPITESGSDYDPLHDDAQAMALVKKCGLLLGKWRITMTGEFQWFVKFESDDAVIDKHLNRAIVECVAKMQKEKK